MEREQSRTRRSVLSDTLGCSVVAAIAGVAAFQNFGAGLAPALADKYDRNKLRHAIEAIEGARDELKQTERGFHGHKAEAMKSMDEALHHLRVLLDNE